MSSAQQPRIIPTLRTLDLHPCRKQRKRTLLNLLMHVLLKQIPTIDDTAANHDHFWIQYIDQVRQPNPEVNTHPPEDLERQFVALLSGFEDRLCRPVLVSLQQRIRMSRADRKS